MISQELTCDLNQEYPSALIECQMQSRSDGGMDKRKISREALRNKLLELDGKGYGAYKNLLGCYQFDDFTLWFDHIQGDPFASPSNLRIVIPQDKAAFPGYLWNIPVRATALADFLNRLFFQETNRLSSRRGSGKSGQISIASPSQVILPRTAVQVKKFGIVVQFSVGLPAFGRRIAGKQAAELICDDLLFLAQRTLFYEAVDKQAIEHHCNTAEDAEALRKQLKTLGLVAFIADRAILPRRSGIDERPLIDGVPFKSPPELRMTLHCPHAGEVSGMGIPTGITLIVGGGYHGKSTLLKAIEFGVYNHIPGDGREQVVTCETAVKIRAEDGRSIKGVDISPFINHLPQDKSTENFSSSNASGSTSQAANIVEAIEAGADVLLIDEDTSASNFMIRDHRMQALIAKDKEPITPFIDKVSQLRLDLGISTILVIGGSGDYFDVADNVITLDSYRPELVTDRAKAIAAEIVSYRIAEGGESFGEQKVRSIKPSSTLLKPGRRSPKLKVRNLHEIYVGDEVINVAAVEQLVETGQLRAIGKAIIYALSNCTKADMLFTEVLDSVMSEVHHNGLDCLGTKSAGDLSMFRRLELAAAINRMRKLKTLGHDTQP